jgi:hypothetical protein
VACSEDPEIALLCKGFEAWNNPSSPKARLYRHECGVLGPILDPPDWPEVPPLKVCLELIALRGTDPVQQLQPRELSKRFTCTGPPFARQENDTVRESTTDRAKPRAAIILMRSPEALALQLPNPRLEHIENVSPPLRPRSEIHHPGIPVRRAPF